MLRTDDFGSVASREAGHRVNVSQHPGRPLPLWRLRASVCAAVLSAFVLELVARYFRTPSVYAPLLSKSISLSALSLLCIVAVYLIFMVEGRSVLKVMVIFATGALVSSQILSISREIPDIPPFPMPVRSAEAFLLLTGVVTLLTSFYFALLETISTKAHLRIEREELYREIAERKQAQSELNLSRDQLRRLTAHVERVREEERTVIAREVHDELGQSLTSLKIDLANLKRVILPAPGSGTKALDTIATMAQQVDTTMNAVRRITSELRPGILDDLGLDAAVEWQAREFQKRTQVDCAIRVEPVEGELGRDKATALFRMMQEALTNIARHSGATRVEVHLRADEGDTVLEISDNGCGFSVEQASFGSRFGIIGMRERAAQFGGLFNIYSSPGHGTHIVVSMPTAESEIQ